jgi:hypothetical protein
VNFRAGAIVCEQTDSARSFDTTSPDYTRFQKHAATGRFRGIAQRAARRAENRCSIQNVRIHRYKLHASLDTDRRAA